MIAAFGVSTLIATNPARGDHMLEKRALIVGGAAILTLRFDTLADFS